MANKLRWYVENGLSSKKISDYGKNSSPILQDYDHRMHVARKPTQLTFTCSKSAIKA